MPTLDELYRKRAEIIRELREAERSMDDTQLIADLGLKLIHAGRDIELGKRARGTVGGAVTFQTP